MQIKQPKKSDRYSWTQHVWGKMQHYAISEQMIRRVIRNPERVEEGIAPNTIAVMQSRGTKRKHEIWVLYQITKTQKSQKTQDHNKKIRIITAWRYPGVSPKRAAIPIPQDIIEELGIKI